MEELCDTKLSADDPDLKGEPNFSSSEIPGKKASIAKGISMLRRISVSIFGYSQDAKNDHPKDEQGAQYSALDNAQCCEAFKYSEKWDFLTARLCERENRIHLLANVAKRPSGVDAFYDELEVEHGVALSADARQLYYEEFFQLASGFDMLHASEVEFLLKTKLQLNLGADNLREEISKFSANCKESIVFEDGLYTFELYCALICTILKGNMVAVHDSVSQPDTEQRSILPIDPDSVPKQAWNLCCSLLLLYCAFSVPYSIAFEQSSGMSARDYSDLFIDAIFMVDIALAFVTAYEDQGCTVRDLRRIANHYLRTWFLPDIAGTFPFDTVLTLALESSGSSSVSSLGSLRFIRMLRLVRAWKFVNQLKKLKDRDGFEAVGTAVTLATALFILIFSAHILGCIFTIIMSNEPDNNWLLHYNAELAAGDAWVRYLCAMYWATITLTTMGYGDITPVTDIERCYVILVALVGAVIFSHCLGTISSLISQVAGVDDRFQARARAVQEYLQFRAVAPDLRRRIKAHYQLCWRRSPGLYEERTILDDLSHSLRAQVPAAAAPSSPAPAPPTRRAGDFRPPARAGPHPRHGGRASIHPSTCAQQLLSLRADLVEHIHIRASLGPSSLDPPGSTPFGMLRPRPPPPYRAHVTIARAPQLLRSIGARAAEELPALAGLGEECIGFIATRLRRTAYAEGEVLYQHGDEASEMHIIVVGTVTLHTERLSRHHSSRAGHRPSRAVVAGSCAGLEVDGAAATAGDGDLFGELGLFPDAHGAFRTETAVSRSWGRGYSLSATDMPELEVRYPAAAEHLRELCGLKSVERTVTTTAKITPPLPSVCCGEGSGPDGNDGNDRAAGPCQIRMRTERLRAELLQRREAALLVPATCWACSGILPLLCRAPAGSAGSSRALLGRAAPVAAALQGVSCVFSESGELLLIEHSLAGIAATRPTSMGFLRAGVSSVRVLGQDELARFGGWGRRRIFGCALELFRSALEQPLAARNGGTCVKPISQTTRGGQNLFLLDLPLGPAGGLVLELFTWSPEVFANFHRTVRMLSKIDRESSGTPCADKANNASMEDSGQNHALGHNGVYTLFPADRELCSEFDANLKHKAPVDVSQSPPDIRPIEVQSASTKGSSLGRNGPAAGITTVQDGCDEMKNQPNAGPFLPQPETYADSTAIGELRAQLAEAVERAKLAELRAEQLQRAVRAALDSPGQGATDSTEFESVFMQLSSPAKS